MWQDSAPAPLAWAAPMARKAGQPALHHGTSSEGPDAAAGCSGRAADA